MPACPTDQKHWPVMIGPLRTQSHRDCTDTRVLALQPILILGSFFYSAYEEIKTCFPLILLPTCQLFQLSMLPTCSYVPKDISTYLFCYNPNSIIFTCLLSITDYQKILLKVNLCYPQ